MKLAGEIGRSVLKVGLATAAFGLVHSALASRAAKDLAARLLGPRRRNALYRPFYLAQSLVTFGALLAYLNRQPARTLYDVRGPWATLMRAGQASGLAWATYAAYHVGIPRMLGAAQLLAWVKGETVAPEPEAQGPAADGRGRMRVRGPFRVHRHPLNFAPLPVIWLFPRMTTRLAAMNLVATIYLVIGSKHEERRLVRAYGAAYERYRRSGVPFYLPTGTHIGG